MLMYDSGITCHYRGIYFENSIFTNSLNFPWQNIAIQCNNEK